MRATSLSQTFFILFVCIFSLIIFVVGTVHKDTFAWVFMVVGVIYGLMFRSHYKKLKKQTKS